MRVRIGGDKATWTARSLRGPFAGILISIGAILIWAAITDVVYPSGIPSKLTWVYYLRDWTGIPLGIAVGISLLWVAIRVGSSVAVATNSAGVYIGGLRPISLPWSALRKVSLSATRPSSRRRVVTLELHNGIVLYVKGSVSRVAPSDAEYGDFSGGDFIGPSRRRPRAVAVAAELTRQLAAATDTSTNTAVSIAGRADANDVRGAHRVKSLPDALSISRGRRTSVWGRFRQGGAWALLAGVLRVTGTIARTSEASGHGASPGQLLVDFAIAFVLASVLVVAALTFSVNEVAISSDWIAERRTFRRSWRIIYFQDLVSAALMPRTTRLSSGTLIVTGNAQLCGPDRRRFVVPLWLLSRDGAGEQFHLLAQNPAVFEDLRAYLGANANTAMGGIPLRARRMSPITSKAALVVSMVFVLAFDSAAIVIGIARDLQWVEIIAGLSVLFAAGYVVLRSATPATKFPGTKADWSSRTVSTFPSTNSSRLRGSAPLRGPRLSLGVSPGRATAVLLGLAEITAVLALVGASLASGVAFGGNGPSPHYPLQSLSSSSIAIPPVLYQGSNGAPYLTPSDAQAIGNELWVQHLQAMAEKAPAIVQSIETGPSRDYDVELLESMKYGVAESPRLPVAPATTSVVYLSRQSSYPLFFVDLVGIANPAPYEGQAQVLVVTRGNAVAPWKLAMDIALDAPPSRVLPPPVIDASGYDIAPQAGGFGGASSWLGQLSAYYAAWKVTGASPVASNFLTGPTTSVYGQTLVANRSGEIIDGGGVRADFGFVNPIPTHGWVFGAGGVPIACGSVVELASFTPMGSYLNQSPNRVNWGPGVAPGHFSKIVSVYQNWVCVFDVNGSGLGAFGNPAMETGEYGIR